MAHFAKLGINSKVISVSVVNNDDCKNADGIEDESVGIQFLENLHGWPLWKQTSYNTTANTHTLGGTPFRKNYAGIGYTYDEDRDAFIPPKPHASWVLNETSCTYDAPVAYPNVTEYGDPAKRYRIRWDETNTRWTAEDEETPIGNFRWNDSTKAWVSIQRGSYIMASEIKVNKISPGSGTSFTVGDSGDTFTIPSGVVFDRTLDWQSVQTSTIAATAGKGYPVNTTSGTLTMNLPAGSAGDQIAVVDYAGTFDTNKLTISANGSEKINGMTVDITLETERQGATLTYIDSTQGWLVTSSAPDPGVSQLIPVTFKIWGAGGGGSAGGADGRGGGGGGFVQGTQSFASGTSIIAVVGQGGSGGTGGKGGGGGGYTGVFNGSVTHGNALLIAGAGSGGARSTYYGTGGGGLAAGDGTGANPGGGGNQVGGGAAGSGNGVAGAALQGGSAPAGSGGTAFGGGGDGGGDNVSYTAGGGGSGYYGGGSAGNSGDGASGGAGSSYVGSMTSTTNTTGTSASSGIAGGAAVNTSDSEYASGTNVGGEGNSSSGSGNIGGHGSISYSINGAAYVTLSYTGGNQTITVSQEL